MDSYGEASIFIEFILALLSAESAVSWRLKVYICLQLVFQLLVPFFLLDSKWGRINVAVFSVVDIKILLAVLGKNRIELKEVLSTHGTLTWHAPVYPPNQTYHICGIMIIIYQSSNYN